MLDYFSKDITKWVLKAYYRRGLYKLTSADRWKFRVETGGKATSLRRSDEEMSFVAVVLDSGPDPEVRRDQGGVGGLFGFAASSGSCKCLRNIRILRIILTIEM